jgi:hypothetical protein
MIHSITTTEIIERFKNAGIEIKDTDCKKSHNGMVTVMHPDFGIKFYPTYYTAFYFYSSRKLI